MSDNKSESSRIMEALTKVYEKTLFSISLGQSKKADWVKEQKHSFESAKLLSDFVGMLVRLGFVTIAILYFSSESRSAPSLFSSITNGICAMFAAGLYFVLMLKVAKVTFVYWLSDTAQRNGRFHKVAITLIALLQTIVAVYGTAKLARAVAEASMIIH